MSKKQINRQDQNDDKDNITQLEERYKSNKPKTRTSKESPFKEQTGQINRGKGPKNLKR